MSPLLAIAIASAVTAAIIAVLCLGVFVGVTLYSGTSSGKAAALLFVLAAVALTAHCLTKIEAGEISRAAPGYPWPADLNSCSEPRRPL